MKIPKTLVFIVTNPLTFIVSLFASWILFSALTTLSDDSFIYGTLPDVVTAPSIQKALSLIIEEIVVDFVFELYWIAIPCALIISYREARGCVKGIAKERQVWIPWYHQQQHAIAQGNILEASPITSEYTQTNSYFKKAQNTLFRLIQHLMSFFIHFSCWFSAFAVLIIIGQLGNRIEEIAYYLVRFFPEIAIPVVILAFLSCYREARGTKKAISKEREIWMNWYDAWMKWCQRQQEAKVLGYVLNEAPPFLNPKLINSESSFS